MLADAALFVVPSGGQNLGRRVPGVRPEPPRTARRSRSHVVLARDDLTGPTLLATPQRQPDCLGPDEEAQGDGAAQPLADVQRGAAHPGEAAGLRRRAVAVVVRRWQERRPYLAGVRVAGQRQPGAA